MRYLLYLLGGGVVCYIFLLRKFFVFYADRYMCQIAENQAWKSISNAAMEIGLYCRIWNFMLLYYYLESSCREGKTRLFLELHSKRIRNNVNKLHPKPPIPVDGKGKKYNHHEKLAKHLNRFPEVIWNLHPWRCSDFKRRRPWVAWRKLKVSPALNSFWMRHLQIFFHATWFCFFLQGTEVALCSLGTCCLSPDFSAPK